MKLEDLLCSETLKNFNEIVEEAQQIRTLRDLCPPSMTPADFKTMIYAETTDVDIVVKVPEEQKRTCNSVPSY